MLVVYGLWCHDSKRIVPEVLKAMASAGNENLQLLTVHVSYAETDPSPFMAGPVDVARYPTIAFLTGRFQTVEQIAEGVEKVRFVERSPDAEKIAAAFGSVHCTHLVDAADGRLSSAPEGQYNHSRGREPPESASKTF